MIAVEHDYFGTPWTSGVCLDGHRVVTPVGEVCPLCAEVIVPGDRGTVIGDALPVHRECLLRELVGGIGHLEDHAYWCVEHENPDGGRTQRISALEVWRLLEVSDEMPFGRTPAEDRATARRPVLRRLFGRGC